MGSGGLIIVARLTSRATERAGGVVGEDCLSAKREFRSRRQNLSSAGYRALFARRGIGHVLLGTFLAPRKVPRLPGRDPANHPEARCRNKRTGLGDNAPTPALPLAGEGAKVGLHASLGTGRKIELVAIGNCPNGAMNASAVFENCCTLTRASYRLVLSCWLLQHPRLGV